MYEGKAKHFYWENLISKTYHSQFKWKIQSFPNVIPVKCPGFSMKTWQVSPKITSERKKCIKIAQIKYLKNRNELVVALLVIKTCHRKTWNKQKCCFGAGIDNRTVQGRIIFLKKQTDGLC